MVKLLGLLKFSGIHQQCNNSAMQQLNRRIVKELGLSKFSGTNQQYNNLTMQQ